jgi:RNA polymerase sigma-70 factor, ECF subfamily
MRTEDTDEELMRRVADGDVFAFTALVRRHTTAVYRTSYRMLYDQQEAEDVTQESFTRLWQSAPRWCGTRGGVPAWLHRVCMNLCLDILRKKTKFSSVEVPELLDPALTADRLIEKSQAQNALEACLEALPVSHRAAIVLTYYEGQSNKVAANILNMELKAFESLLFRARKRLGSLLSEGGLVPCDLELIAL